MEHGSTGWYTVSSKENYHKNGMIRTVKNRSMLLRIFGASFFLLISIEENGPYPAFAGALSHLKTDFHFSLPDSNKLGNLLNLLLPHLPFADFPKKRHIGLFRIMRSTIVDITLVSLVH